MNHTPPIPPPLSTCHESEAIAWRANRANRNQRERLYQLATPPISSGDSDHSEENNYEGKVDEVQRRKAKSKYFVKYRRGKKGDTLGKSER